MNKYGAFLMQCFEDKLAELKMIYRGTDHEFTRKSWDVLCVNKGPTLTVIQAENGRIFGGYTQSSYAEREHWGNPDDKAWIISFHHQT
jgi:hypothetical protein